MPGCAAEIAVGVTGHRVLAAPDKVEAGVEAALDRIEASYPGARPAAVSSLAEGADRIVARSVLARGGRLSAVLPMSPNHYVCDFDDDASVLEFHRLLASDSRPVILQSAGSRDAAYEAAGMYVLDNCDVLVAVWDGAQALGRGGTGEMVQLARERRLPIAWVKAGNRDPMTGAPTSLGSDQGQLQILGEWPR